MKGIILAGGSGTRLAPMTAVVGKRPKLCLLCRLFLAISFFPVLAQALEKPIVTAQAFLREETQPSVRPQVIIKTDDGGFIIAGEAFANHIKAAGAIKTDAKGKMLWNYTTTLPDKWPTYATFSPEYHGAVSMPDGSSFLCGSMPRPVGAYSPGLLTHLDAHGRVLSEKFFIPQNSPALGIARFDDCAKWGDGVAVLGHVLQIYQTASGPNMPVTKDVYWVLFLDAIGNIKWEKQIPVATQFFVSEVGPLLATTKSDLVFSAINNDRTRSELIEVGADGEVRASTQLSGGFQLVRPTTPDSIIQLYGWDAAKKQALITFNERLEEGEEIEGGNADYFARLVYRLPDKSLLLFGSGIHVIGEKYTSRIVHVDSALKSEHHIDLLDDPKHLFDGGSIWAAAAGRNADEFASARFAFILKGNNKPFANASADFKRGVVLDFIQLK